jgi:hypothetical protein
LEKMEKSDPWQEAAKERAEPEQRRKEPEQSL